MPSISSKWVFVMFVLSFIIIDCSGILFAEYMLDFLVFIPLLVVGLALIVFGTIAKIKY